MLDSQGIEHHQCFSVYLHFNFIIFSAEDTALHKYVVQNGRCMVKAISETGGNSVQISSQNSFNDFVFLMQLKSATQTADFKIKHG